LETRRPFGAANWIIYWKLNRPSLYAQIMYKRKIDLLKLHIIYLKHFI
jgi:hypothetical protein